MRFLFTVACLLAAAVAEAEVGEAVVAQCLCDQVKIETEAHFQKKVDICQREKEELHSSAQARMVQAIAETKADVQRAADASVKHLQKELEMSKQESAVLKNESAVLKNEKAALEKKAAELASISDKTREVETYKSQVTSLNAHLQTCQSDMANKVGAYQKEAQTRTAELKRAETSIKELQNAVSSNKATSEQLQQCQAESIKLNGQMDSMARDHMQKEMKLQSDLTLIRNNLESLKEDHAKSTNVIYSSEQFSRQLQHGKIIGTAFLKFSHHRMVTLIGKNNYDLITLQASVFASAANRHILALYRPVRHQVVTIYQSHGERLVQPIAEKVTYYYQRVKSYAQDRSRQILTYVDNYMNRLITNLSSVDPDVRSVFPESFNDRCFAFAFVSLILFILSEVVQWTFSKCIATPISYMLGLNVTTKTAKKTSKTSSSSSSSKSKSSTSTKSASAASSASKDSTSKKTKTVKA